MKDKAMIQLVGGPYDGMTIHLPDNMIGLKYVFRVTSDELHNAVSEKGDVVYVRVKEDGNRCYYEGIVERMPKKQKPEGSGS